jgi:hypothetical protein
MLEGLPVSTTCPVGVSRPVSASRWDATTLSLSMFAAESASSRGHRGRDAGGAAAERPPFASGAIPRADGRIA